MNIMVFDVPAINGGALSVLKEFHNEAMHYHDKNVNWFFVVSKPDLKETQNIKVLRYPWIKKSWFHRYYFDNIYAINLLKKYKIDKIISLQNVMIPFTNTKQILYVHNSLPFIEYSFAFNENKLLWIYQNIIGKRIINSIKNVDRVVVQSEWMKEACLKKTGINYEKVDVVQPLVDIEISNYFKSNEKSNSTFFYPASGFNYKNHKIIVDSCKKLFEQGVFNFQVLFTLLGNESKEITELYNEVKKLGLPVNFIGTLSREQVFEYYTKSVLVFPSYIETVGLPMLEARFHQGLIFASNCSFSKEILDDYKNAYFFDPFNVNELTELMKKSIKMNINFFNVSYRNDNLNRKLSLIDITMR